MATLLQEIPGHVMSSLNQYRKAINSIDASSFKFLRYLQPGEVADVPLDETIHVEREVKDSSKKKKEKKVKRSLVDDPECEAITTGLITDFLKEKLRLSLPEDSVLLNATITELGEHTIPLKINHLLVSGIEERYLDPDIIQRADYELKVTFAKGVRAKAVKVEKASEENAEGKDKAAAAEGDDGDDDGTEALELNLAKTTSSKTGAKGAAAAKEAKPASKKGASSK